jgi:hypothetical protein
MSTKALIEEKKLYLRISKANAAKDELELQIMEREVEIQRIKDHLLLQDKVIAEATKELESFKNQN